MNTSQDNNNLNAVGGPKETNTGYVNYNLNTNNKYSHIDTKPQHISEIIYGEKPANLPKDRHYLWKDFSRNQYVKPFFHGVVGSQYSMPYASSSSNLYRHISSPVPHNNYSERIVPGELPEASYSRSSFDFPLAQHVAGVNIPPALTRTYETHTDPRYPPKVPVSKSKGTLYHNTGSVDPSVNHAYNNIATAENHQTNHNGFLSFLESKEKNMNRNKKRLERRNNFGITNMNRNLYELRNRNYMNRNMLLRRNSEVEEKIEKKELKKEKEISTDKITNKSHKNADLREENNTSKKQVKTKSTNTSKNELKNNTKEKKNVENKTKTKIVEEKTNNKVSEPSKQTNSHKENSKGKSKNIEEKANLVNAQTAAEQNKTNQITAKNILDSSSDQDHAEEKATKVNRVSDKNHLESVRKEALNNLRSAEHRLRKLRLAAKDPNLSGKMVLPIVTSHVRDNSIGLYPDAKLKERINELKRTEIGAAAENEKPFLPPRPSAF